MPANISADESSLFSEICSAVQDRCNTIITANITSEIEAIIASFNDRSTPLTKKIYELGADSFESYALFLKHIRKNQFRYILENTTNDELCEIAHHINSLVRHNVMLPTQYHANIAEILNTTHMYKTTIESEKPIRLHHTNGIYTSLQRLITVQNNAYE